MSRLIPNTNWTRALLAPALVFIATATDRNYQTDFWHHLARGRAIAERGELVNTDLFTYTVAGQPLQDVNWLPQLLYFHLCNLGGLGLVQAVNSLVLAAMMAVLVAHCRRVSGSLLLAAGVGVFTFFGLWQLLIIRPQTFSLLLFVVLSLVLELSDGRRWLLLVPPFIMALWTNVHGGFPIGLYLIGAYLLGFVAERVWSHKWSVLRDGRVWALAICLLLSMAATLVNPYGWRVYEYVGITSTSASARRIDEWLPPQLGLLTGKVWLASILLLLVLLALPGRRPTIRQVCLIICFLPLACGSVRMVAWWLLVAAPIFASLLVDRLPRSVGAEEEDKKLSWADGLIFTSILAALLLSLPWLERYNPVLANSSRAHRAEYDLALIADHLRERPGSRIFSRFEWSEYLGWALTPQYTVFMDGRIEIFPDRVWQEYDSITRGRADWQDVLDRYGVDSLLLDKTGYHAGLLPEVEKSVVWQRDMEAGDAVLFVRRPCDVTVHR